MAGQHALTHDPNHTLDHIATDEAAGGNYLRYLNVLRELGNQGAAVNTALIEAHTADTIQQRRAALTTLHNRLRDMGSDRQRGPRQLAGTRRSRAMIRLRRRSS